MPQSTCVALSPAEHRQIRAALRRARYGYLLARHLLVVCAAGCAPTDIAVVLFCARSSVDRPVRAYRQGTLGWAHDAHGRLLPPLRTTGLGPTLRQSLVSRLKATPRAYGWGRTRWRGAPLALTLQAQRGVVGSAATRRRWLHERGGVGK